jgi:hypothetical protein
LTESALATATFPDVAWFRQFAAFLERDEDFRRHGPWLTARIAFRVDQETVVVALDRGLVLDVAPGHGEFDFLVKGTREQWAFLFDARWGLVRLYRTGTLAIRADPVRLMQNWKSLFFLVEAMKSFGRQA